MKQPELKPVPKEVHDPGGLRYGDGFISHVYPRKETPVKPSLWQKLTAWSRPC